MTDQKIAAGIIRTSFGVKGELKITSLSGEIKHFFSLKEVFLKDKKDQIYPFEVEYFKKFNDDLLMKLKGIDSPEKGREYANFEILINRENANPLKDDEYYYADLCGCTVYLIDQEIGSVTMVVEGSSADLLEIKTKERESFFVPFMNQFVGEVNIKEKKIYLKEDAGLL